MDRLTRETFILKAKIIHGDKYDYNKIAYKNNKTLVIIGCSKHGDYSQIPNSHLLGKGCKKCAIEYISSKKLFTNEDFIIRANEVHGDRYIYTETDYLKSNLKVNIICRKHGIFKQTPNNHLNGQHCPICVNKKLSNSEFIKKANDIHSKKYLYDKTKYRNYRAMIKIECPKHGIFKQLASNHLQGRGCPICKESKGEIAIRKFLEKNAIQYEFQKFFNECRNIKTLPFDFYLPKRNILIEYDGIQHYKAFNFFGGLKRLNDYKKNDSIKNKFADDKGIKLLRISYRDFDKVEEILKEEINHIY